MSDNGGKFDWSRRAPKKTKEEEERERQQYVEFCARISSDEWLGITLAQEGACPDRFQAAYAAEAARRGLTALDILRYALTHKQGLLKSTQTELKERQEAVARVEIRIEELEAKEAKELVP